ncbi:MAG: hypothetical protein Q9195_000373 [Heterodermia aff. obscurata]
MSILGTPKAPRSDGNLHTLKAELKEWEKAFAAAHGGRKAGREDIKQHPDIATKYKQYNRLRSGPVNAVPIPEIKKRQSPAVPPNQSSPKRAKLSQPPHPATLDPYESPRSIHQTPIRQRTYIGPTPQKDGRVLGLFDLLSPDSRDGNTPAKRISLGAANLNTLATPLKPLLDKETGTGGDNSVRRTSSKSTRSAEGGHRDSFLTPSNRRKSHHRTPRSQCRVSKLSYDATPAFLRRDSIRTQNELQGDGKGDVDEHEEISWSPIAVRPRAKPLGRSLSTLVHGLRALEDEKLDEEMELMREMEQDSVIDAGTQQASFENPIVAVGDSQITELPLGPDGAGNSEDDNDDAHIEAQGKDGKPLKVWKKKGQKRTTRKVNMRPSAAKWKPETQWEAPKDTKAEDEVAVVLETQIVGQAVTCDVATGGEEGDDVEYLTEGTYESNDDRDGTKTAGRERIKSKIKSDDKSGKNNIQAPTKKKNRKINPLAHANFRALKIKNKQSKAKGSGRYGRRRR